MAFELPVLPYAPTALEPHISARTIEFHYGKHHQAYVNNLNNLVPGTKFENASLGKVLSQLERAFGVNFKLNDQSVLAQKITAKFEKNSIKTISEVIKSLTGLDYKIVERNNDKKEVQFFGNPKSRMN